MDRRDAGLDAVRACAIWLVMASHGITDLPAVEPTALNYLTFSTAAVGVEIFFGLSGFLIGNILLDIEPAGFSGSNVGRFLARRWLRTLPLYYAFLLFTVWMWPANRQTVPAFFVMLQSLFGSAPQPNDFPQSWSLPIEEFSYILLALLAFALRRTRRPVLYATLVLLILAPLIRGLFADHQPFSDIRVGTAWRLDAIGYGVLAAFVARQVPGLLSRHRRAIMLIAAATVIVHAALFAFPIALANLYGDVFALPAFAIAIAALLPMLRTPVVLSPGVTRLTAITSRLSYSLYIIHLVAASLVHVILSGWGIPARIVAYVVLSYAAAWLLNVAIERPFMAWRPASQAARPTIAVARTGDA